MTFHVLVPDNVHKTAIEKLEAAEDIRVTAPGNMSREETLAAVSSAHALIIRSATKADAELLDHAPELKCIARAGVGVDNIDLEKATANGVVVMNTPSGNTTSTAEHTFALMLSLARHVPRAHLYMRDGRWERKLFMGTELMGKTLGVVGFGRVGQAVAKRALAFEMKVLAYDPLVGDELIQDQGAQPADLDQLYAQSDFITLHTIITDQTHGMINADTISKMKPGVRLVNAARGPLIVDEDVSAALKEGRIAGIALDVYGEEPPPAEHPLIAHESVVHTPHIAASTTDAQINVAVEAADLVITGLRDGTYHNVVNPSVLG